MAKTEYARLRSPIEECHTFIGASGDYTAGNPQIVNDVLVIPLETAASTTAVCAYEVPKVEVRKISSETWITGQKVYWQDYSVAEGSAGFTNDNSLLLGVTGIVTKAAATGTTYGEINFVGYQVPSELLDIS